MEILKQVLTISIFVSTISCSFVQKTKVNFKSSKFLIIYSFLINLVISILFCMSFTSLNFIYSLWIGFFAFIGADTIFKLLEGKIFSYRDLKNK